MAKEIPQEKMMTQKNEKMMLKLRPELRKIGKVFTHRRKGYYYCKLWRISEANTIKSLRIVRAMIKNVMIGEIEDNKISIKKVRWMPYFNTNKNIYSVVIRVPYKKGGQK